MSCPPRGRWPAAVLFDRDGTLVHDVPYNADPALVELVSGARSAVALARGAGLAVGLVTNQSVVGLGRATVAQVAAVNRRVGDLVGGFDVEAVCPHRPDAGCRCRKPEPGLITSAAAALGLDPQRCVVIGDIASDLWAAAAAGASGILVPTEATDPTEVAQVTELGRHRNLCDAKSLGGSAPRGAGNPRAEQAQVTPALASVRIGSAGDVLAATRIAIAWLSARADEAAPTEGPGSLEPFCATP